MYIASALRTDRMCKALTGLTVSEFNNLVIDFEWNYKEFEAKRKKKRERKIGGGRNSKIETVKEKLFYVLWYMKTYPTFDVASFGSYRIVLWCNNGEYSRMLEYDKRTSYPPTHIS